VRVHVGLGATYAVLGEHRAAALARQLAESDPGGQDRAAAQRLRTRKSGSSTALANAFEPISKRKRLAALLVLGAIPVERHAGTDLRADGLVDQPFPRAAIPR
jgi:hypothetical protein